MQNTPSSILIVIFVLALCAIVPAQGTAKRTTLKSDTLDFGPGGTLAVVGAPVGSIRVEGWNNSQVQIDAEIKISAPTEADLDLIAKLTGFVLQESMGRTEITSVGTHNKDYMKQTAKKFPKTLLGLPFRIDYVIKVPRYCDIQIDGGKGDLYVGGIDGTIKINYLDSNAKLDLLGGGIFATFGSGTVDVSVPSRSWRGRFADIQLAAGTMNVSLPPSLNAQFDAAILRSGSISNEYPELKPRTRKDAFTEKLIAAKSGVGGVPLKFTVGDGSLNIFGPKRPE